MLPRTLTCVCVLALATVLVVAPPPKREAVDVPPVQEPQHPRPDDEESMNKFEYDRYLQEVVKALEKDEQFMAKLNNASEDYIKSGKIADHMEELGIEARDQLHEVKRREVDRLRAAVQKQMELEGGGHNIKMPEHLDLNNLDEFRKEDLVKLIQKTTKDIDDLEVKRKEKFKEHEMKQRAEYDHKLEGMDAAARKQAEEEHARQQQRHKDHEKLKHPASRDQLEEVWNEDDKMEGQEFDAKTFFNLHDLNGDGQLDQWELDALFQNELDKAYNESNPDDDPAERYEEMAKMQEHVLKQMDKDANGMISMKEFLEDPEVEGKGKKPDDWNTLDEQPQYTDEELKRFEEEYYKQQGWQVPTQPHVPPHEQQQNHIPQQQQGVPAHQGQVPQQQQGQGQPVPRQGQVPQQGQPVPQQGQPVVPQQGQPVPQQGQHVPQTEYHAEAGAGQVPQQQGQGQPVVPQHQQQPPNPDRTYGI